MYLREGQHATPMVFILTLHSRNEEDGNGNIIIRPVHAQAREKAFLILCVSITCELYR